MNANNAHVCGGATPWYGMVVVCLNRIMQKPEGDLDALGPDRCGPFEMRHQENYISNVGHRACTAPHY